MNDTNAYAPPTAKLESNQKPCQECGAAINKKAEICPKCGVRQKGMVSKVTLLLLAFFGGGLGLHKFYLRKPIQGILYVLFFWTWIPGLIAFVEFLVYACTSEERLNEKYEATSSAGLIAVAVVAVFGVIFMAGIVAAIAVPAYNDYLMRARASAAMQGAEPLRQRIEQHIVTTGKIPQTAAEVPGVKPVALNDPRTGKPFATAQLADQGVIVIEFDEGSDALAGKTIEWAPYVRDGRLAWRCSGGTLAARYRMLACRGP